MVGELRIPGAKNGVGADAAELMTVGYLSCAPVTPWQEFWKAIRPKRLPAGEFPVAALFVDRFLRPAVNVL